MEMDDYACTVCGEHPSASAYVCRACGAVESEDPYPTIGCRCIATAHLCARCNSYLAPTNASDENATE